MKKLLYGYVFMFLACAIAPSAVGQPIQCNSYLWQLCFEIGRGDKVTTSIIADFVITEIELQNGARVTSYEGIGLATPDFSGTPVQVRVYQTGDLAVQVYAGRMRTARGQYFSVHHGPRGDQIFGWFNTVEEGAAIANFFRTFRICQRGQPNIASITCTNEQAFLEAADVIGAL